jgi:hypothetical protein
MVTSLQRITMYLTFCTTTMVNLLIIWCMVSSFNHLSIHGIGPVLVRCVFHLQKLKQMIHALEINQGSTKFQELEHNNKLDEFVLLVHTNSSNTCKVNNYASTLACPQAFIFCMLALSWHEVLSHNTTKPCNLVFVLACMFLQAIKLRHQNLFMSFNLAINFTTNHS